MFTKIGKLLITKIKNTDLYNFAVRFAAMVSAVLGDNPAIAPYIVAVMDAVERMEKVISRNLKNPLTAQVKRKNKERIYLLAALRRAIGVSQMMIANSERVEVVNRIKQEMKDRGWWKYTKLCYAEITTIIRTMLAKVGESPLSEWMSTAELLPICDSIKQAQEEFEVLVNERIDMKSKDTTLQMIVARKNLADVILALLAAIDFGVKSDPATYTEIGDIASDMIIEVNAKTLMRQTLAANGEEEPVDDDFVSEGEIEPESEPEAEGEAEEGGTAYE